MPISPDTSIGTLRCAALLRLFISVGTVSFLTLGANRVQSAPQSVTIAGDIRVFDGDTVEIGPMLIRLHGIDAPEKSQRCQSKTGGQWACGAAATRYLEELIDGQKLKCEALDRDPYGRIISRCTVSGRDIGAAMIEEGLAWAFVEYRDDYIHREDAAWQFSKGVWQAATQTPWDFRDDKWNRALATAPNGTCPIKGNINLGKEKRKIYHTPWSPNHGNTKINEEQGERCFCNEAQA